MPDKERENGTPAVTIAIVTVALAALFVLTGFVTGAYRAERRSRGQLHYQMGVALAQHGKNQEALEEFQAALSFSRGQPEYQLALSRALLDLGRLGEAETHLRELRQADPTNGVVNLLLARIAVQQGNLDEGAIYYHTAIYGLWPDHPEQHRIETRFELIDILKKRGAKQQALAELLEMMDRVPAEDIPTRKRLGALLLASDAPRQAEEVFADVVRRQSHDAEAYAGLAKAQFARGDYRLARNSFRQALRWKPDDPDVHKRLEVCEQILSLDPDARGLSAADRFARSRRLLQETADYLDACLQKSPNSAPGQGQISTQASGQPPAPTQSQSSAQTPGQSQATQSQAPDPLDAARKMLARRPPRQPSDGATESNLSLAEQLWSARTRACGPPDESTQALTLVMAQLTR
jgi:tetratricopeptide (TPR) repeat protein